MSTINTNGLDVNYPIPGQNNSSQGFRNNFTNIKQNLDIASEEISDLQNKAVLKSALSNSTLNNDMANTLIANASTLQFRATTYNLGNALSNVVIVNCSLGDVQYGNLAGNVSLQFGSWAPTNTQSKVQLQLGRPDSNSNYTVTFPSQVIFSENYGIKLVENVSNSTGNTTITFPYNTTQLNFTLTSNDCGNSIFVEPTNRPYQSTQIQTRTPPPTGYLGDVPGTVAVDANYVYVCTGTFNGSTLTYPIQSTLAPDLIIFDAGVVLSPSVVDNMPVVFSDMVIAGVPVTSFGGLVSGQVYYVKTLEGGLGISMKVSSTRTGGVAGSILPVTTVTSAPLTSMNATFLLGSNIWKRAALSTW